MKKLGTCGLWLAASVAVLSSSGAAQTDAAAARRTARAVGPCVVTVQAVVRITVSSPEGQSEKQEQRFESYGTVIDKSGLIAACLSTIDPSSLTRGIPGANGMNIQSQITDLTVRLSDGAEMPGKVVLRDRDQDLAFIRTLQPPKTPLVALDLKAAATPDLLDPVLVVARLPKVLNRGLSARWDAVAAVVDRPRKRYVLNTSAVNPVELGCPVVAPGGAPVGILVTKMQRTGGDDGTRSMAGNLAFVVVPAADILAVLEQVPPDAGRAGAK